MSAYARLEVSVIDGDTDGVELTYSDGVPPEVFGMCDAINSFLQPVAGGTPSQCEVSRYSDDLSMSSWLDYPIDVATLRPQAEAALTALGFTVSPSPSGEEYTSFEGNGLTNGSLYFTDGIDEGTSRVSYSFDVSAV